MSDSIYDTEYDGWYDSSEFKTLMQETTANLKKLTAMQNRMRFQFGDAVWYEEFTKSVNESLDGWMSSWC